MQHVRTLIPYYRPYRLQLTGGLAMTVLASGVTALIPWFLRQAIDRMQGGEPLSQIWLLAGGIVLTALASGTLHFGMRQLLNGLSRRIEYDLRNELFTQLESFDAAYYARYRTGDLMARLTNDLNAVRMAVGPAVMYLTNTIFGGLFAIGFMLSISVPLTGLALLPMLVLPVMGIWLGKRIHGRFEAVQEHFSTLTTHVQEHVSGIRVVRAYRQERAETQRFGTLNTGYVERNLSLVRLWGLMHPAFSLFVGMAAVIVLGWGGTQVLRGTLSVGSLVAFSVYLTMLTWPLIALGWVINLFQRGDASMGRLRDILDAEPVLATREPVKHLPRALTGRSIEFRSVGFYYPQAHRASPDEPPRWVLRDISFIVPAGGMLGIAGATGSGKSALIDLIARVYDPQEGEILIDGIPISHLPLDELRQAIGYVPQESILFSETIAENLQYGLAPGINPTSAYDAWRAAARIAQLDDTVRDFPHGYDTMLGERGINLSGGQKQRVALARALARRPSIVLLDDALSAVDTHTESQILRGLRSALDQRTAIIASHRASAFREASEIIVLDRGWIVERGRHADLLSAEGKYWILVRRQQLVDEVTSGV